MSEDATSYGYASRHPVRADRIVVYVERFHGGQMLGAEVRLKVCELGPFPTVESEIVEAYYRCEKMLSKRIEDMAKPIPPHG